jgi:hypothetical protein
MITDNLLISVAEAARVTGYSEWMIRRFACAGVFTAEQPMGRKGGWRILRPSLEKWWSDKRRRSTNRRAV